MYKCNRTITKKELRDNTNYEGSDANFESNISNGRGAKCQYGKLWNVSCDNIELNPTIRKYLDTLHKKD